MRRAAAAVAVLAALGGGAAPARGQAEFGSGSSLIEFGGAAGFRTLEEATVPVTVTGQISVAFHGGQTTGLIVWRPPPGATLVAARFRTNRARGMAAVLAFIGPGDDAAQTRAHVERTDAAGAVHTCSDLASDDYGFVNSQTLKARASLDLGRSSLDLVTTRCAGPLQRDVAGVLPKPTFTFARVRRGGGALDLSAQRTFAAGGLTGTVSSSLVLHLGRSHRQSRPQTPSLVPKLHFRRVRQVEVALTVERLEGAVPVDVAGAHDSAVCAPLDACGLAGTLTLAPRVTSGRGTLYAEAPARHSSRAVRAALGLTAGAPAAGVQSFGFVQLKGGAGTLGAQLARDDGPCADTVPFDAGNVVLAIAGGRLRASYLSSDIGEADPLRSRCPGPTLADVAGDHALATGSVPLSALRAREVTIHLAQGVGFAAGAWSGRSRPDLTLVLRRSRVTERVTKEPSFP